MRSTAETRKAELVTMAMTVREAIVADIRGTVDSIAGEVVRARKETAASETRHSTEATDAIAAGPARLASVTETGLDALDDVAATRKGEAGKAVTDAQATARQLGISEGRRGKKAIDAQVAEAWRLGQQKAATYPDDDRGEVQREAVLKVAAETATKLAEPGPKLQSTLEDSGDDLADGFDGAERTVVDTISSQAKSVRDALTAQGNALTPQLDRITTQVMEGMASASGQADAGLKSVEAAASSELGALEITLTMQVDFALASTLDIIDVQTEAVVNAVQSFVTRTAEVIGGLDRPALEPVEVTVAATEATAVAASDDFSQGLDDMALLAERTFADGQLAVASSTAAIAAGVSGGLADAVGKADEGFAVVASKAQTGIDLIAKEWGATLADAKTSTDSEYGKAVDRLRGDVGRTLEQGRLTLMAKVDEAVVKNREGLDALEGRMEEAAKEARDKYDAPWYKKLGRWLWNALLGLLKALLIALALIVVAVLAIVLIVVGIIEGAVGLLIVGLVLLAAVVAVAVYGIVAGIVARVRSADTWYGAIWGGVVGVLDIVGLPNVIEGTIGRDIVNGRRLTTEEAGERFGGGLFNLLTFIIPLKMKFARARGVPKAPPEIPRTPPPAAPEIPRLGEAPVGTELPRGEPAPPSAPEVPEAQGPPKVEEPSGPPKPAEEAPKPPVEEAPKPPPTEAPKPAPTEAPKPTEPPKPGGTPKPGETEPAPRDPGREALLKEAEQRVADAEEAARQAQKEANEAAENVGKAKTELEYYEAETKSDKARARAKRAEATRLEKEAARRRKNPARGDPIEAENQAKEAKNQAERLEKEAEQAAELADEAKEKARAATKAAKKAERSAPAAEARAKQARGSHQRQVELSQRLDELEARYRALPEVRAKPNISPPMASEAGKLRLEIESVRRQLYGEAAKAGVDLYTRLRAASPGPDATKLALENLNDLPKELRGPNGHPIDVTTGKEMNPADVSPDHMHALKRIAQEPGMDSLTPKQQLEIAELKKNYLPLSETANSSKSGRTMAEWFKTPEGSKVPPALRKILLEAEEQARQHVQDEIQKRIKQNKSSSSP